MSDIKDWADDADLNGEASPAGWPEGMPPSDVNNSAREMMAALRRSYVRQPWYAPGGEIVRVSGTQITITDDAKVTNYSQFYSINQRVRIEGEEYNVTGFVSSISYEEPTTTIEFETDAELPLPGTIKDVYVGLSPAEVQGVAGPNLLGCIIGFTEEASQLGAGLLHANGEKFSPSLFPDLASLYFIGNENDGTPKYRYGCEKVGDEWWPKRPDVRGYFPRFLDDRVAPDEGEEDNRVDPSAPRAVGSTQVDAIRNVAGLFTSGDESQGQGTGPFRRTSDIFGATGTRNTAPVPGYSFDLSRSIPTSSENRPKNIAVVGVIVAYGGVIAGGLADVSELVDMTIEVENQVSEVLQRVNDVDIVNIRGTVDTYNELPSSAEIGDLYKVSSTGSYYVRSEQGSWDNLGGSLEGCLKNTAITTASLGILGHCYNDRGTAVGSESLCGVDSLYGTAIGYLASALSEQSLAIGATSRSTAKGAIQIGHGVNEEENTLKVGFWVENPSVYNRVTDPNYVLLTSDGKIPAERLPDDIGGDAGRVVQLGFNGVLEGGVLTFTPAEGTGTVYEIKDFYAYEIDLLFEAVGEIDDSVTMVIKNGDDTYNIVNVLHDDPTTAVTVGEMKQIMKYSTDIGWRWIFNVRATTTQAGDKVLVMPSTVAAVQEASSYNSLDEAQKTQLLADGTYKGSEVADGEIFTEYDGKFVEFNKIYNDSPDWVSQANTIVSKNNDIKNKDFFVEAKDRIVLVDGNYSYVSFDGITWEKHLIEASTSYDYVIFNGSEFVAFADGSSSTTRKIAKSEDGITWVAYSRTGDAINSGTSTFGFTGSEYFVLDYNGTNIYTSTDAIAWTLKTTLSEAIINMTRGPQGFYGVTSAGKILFSSDLATWTTLAESLPTLLSKSRYMFKDIQYANGLLNVLSSGSNSSYNWTAWSEDGVNWTEGTIDGSYAELAKIKYLGDKWYLVPNGGNSVFVSDDGKSFVNLTLPSDGAYLKALFYGKDKLLAWKGPSAFDSTVSYTSYKSMQPFYEYSLTDLSYNKTEVDAAIAGVDLTGYLKNTTNIDLSSLVVVDDGTTVSQSGAKDQVGVGCSSVKMGGSGATAFGAWTEAQGTGTTALGFGAKSRAARAIQIAQGINTEPNTCYVGLSDTLNVKLLNADGTIPVERLPDSVSTAALMSNSTDADYAIAYGEGATAEEAGTSTGYNSTALNYSVSYGYTADATGLYSVAFGASSQTTGDYATAVGYNAHAMGEHAIQIGYGNNTEAHTMRVAVDQNRNFLLLDENGDIPAERTMNGLITIGSGAPTSSTEGFYGKIYIDSTNSQAYICVGDAGTSWTWKQITS